MKFFNIPSNYDFLKSIYKFVSENFSFNNVTIFLPSRLSINELKRIFFDNLDSSVVLPNMKAIGDIDYDDILSLNYYNIEKNISVIKSTSIVKYKLLLIKKLVEEGIYFDQAINLSEELNKFFNEVEQQELDLKNLDNIVDDEYSIHWQKILKFLKKFGIKWNLFLEEENIVSTNKNYINNIKLYEENFIFNKPNNNIIFAGIFTDVKAVNKLIKTLSKYDNTYYFMKGYLSNCIADEVDSNWYYNNIYNYFDIKNINNLEYSDCKNIDDTFTINSAMCNYSLTDSWYNLKSIKNLSNVKYFVCDNIYEELSIISILILDFISKNGLKNIAIISDKEYSYFIENELENYDLPVNNYFGNSYLNNDFIKYFLLILECYINNFKKEFFINLLINKRISFGYDDETLNKNINDFMLNIISDSINDNGMDFYRLKSNNELNIFFDKILNFYSEIKTKNNMKDLLLSHIKIVKNISKELSEDDLNIINFINNNIIDKVDFYDNLDLESYYKLLKYIFSIQSYRSEYSKYPAINILSSEEARLINYDLIFLFNMNDGYFPKNISTDPWMSKSIRKNFGLIDKEISIGKNAYDFIQFLSQKNVIITRSRRVFGEISFASRFLQRLISILSCNNIVLNTDEKIIETFKIINEKKNFSYSTGIPEPNPDLKYRPKILYATDINNFLKNPYNIYAKYILKLKPLNIFKNSNISSKIGTVIHSVFENYDDKCLKYDLIMKELRKVFFNNDVIVRLYYDKIECSLNNFLSNDLNDCEKEKMKHMILNGFKILAKIDRIEKAENNFIKIIDYKTGSEIKKNDVLNFKNMQLLTEALILNKNGFDVKDVEYWYINYKNNHKTVIDIDSDFLKKIENELLRIIESIKNLPFKSTEESIEYEHLIRIQEWLNHLD